MRRALPTHAGAARLPALMLLTDARRSAHTGPHGELIPLDEQDRSRWDREQIAEGAVLVEQALANAQPELYSVLAAIAALHDEAPSTDAPSGNAGRPRRCRCGVRSCSHAHAKRA